MPVELVRIDDRLIHGQVVVGWGQHLNLQRIILVHDDVATSEWEQELYRLGVPEEMTVEFAAVSDAVAHLAEWRADPRRAIILAADIETVLRLVDGGAGVAAVNVGGIHHRPGRVQKLRYVYLAPDEADKLRRLAARGIAVTAQDVPTARPVSLNDMLGGSTG